MDDSTSLQATIESFLLALASDSLPSLDFDHLHGALSEAVELIKNNSGISSELATLRQDYVQRIGGMTKAMAAVSRNQHALNEAIEQLNHLETLSASELIDRYRSTGARFRDSFPSSFGLLASPSDKPRSRTTYSHYK